VIRGSADPFPQLLTLAGDFQTEAAYHVSGNRSLLEISLYEVGEITSQALGTGLGVGVEYPTRRRAYRLHAHHRLIIRMDDN